MSPAAHAVNAVASLTSPVYLTSIWDLSLGVVLLLAGLFFVSYADPSRAFPLLAGYFIVLLVIGGVLYLIFINAAEQAYQTAEASQDDIRGGDFLSVMLYRFLAAQSLGCIVVVSISLVLTAMMFAVKRLRDRADQR